MILIIDESVNDLIAGLEFEIERIEELKDQGYIEELAPRLIEMLQGMINDIKEEYRKLQELREREAK